MSEQPEHDSIGEMLISGLAQAQAAMQDAMLPERFEYAQVPWSEVNGRAAEGWLLVPMNAQYTAAEPVYVMQRKLGVADEAAGLLQGE